MARNNHDDDSHEKVQEIVTEVRQWFESPTGQAYRKWSEDNKHPALATHLMQDTAEDTPNDIYAGISTVFMLGAMSMRRWMEAKQMAE